MSCDMYGSVFRAEKNSPITISPGRFTVIIMKPEIVNRPGEIVNRPGDIVIGGFFFCHVLNTLL